jgi:hypothetical protein
MWKHFSGQTPVFDWLKFERSSRLSARLVQGIAFFGRLPNSLTENCPDSSIVRIFGAGRDPFGPAVGGACPPRPQLCLPPQQVGAQFLGQPQLARGVLFVLVPDFLSHRLAIPRDNLPMLTRNYAPLWLSDDHGRKFQSLCTHRLRKQD